MFEAPRHHGVVSAEDTQSVAVGMFQQQPQAEAMMPLVLGGYRQLIRKEENKRVFLKRPRVPSCVNVVSWQHRLRHLVENIP